MTSVRVGVLDCEAIRGAFLRDEAVRQTAARDHNLALPAASGKIMSDPRNPVAQRDAFH